MTLEKKSPLIQASEVIALTFVIFGIGYYIDPQDALLLHHNSVFNIMVSSCQLFYGLSQRYCNVGSLYNSISISI